MSFDRSHTRVTVRRLLCGCMMVCLLKCNFLVQLYMRRVHHTCVWWYIRCVALLKCRCKTTMIDYAYKIHTTQWIIKRAGRCRSFWICIPYCIYVLYISIFYNFNCTCSGIDKVCCFHWLSNRVNRIAIIFFCNRCCWKSCASYLVRLCSTDWSINVRNTNTFALSYTHSRRWSASSDLMFSTATTSNCARYSMGVSKAILCSRSLWHINMMKQLANSTYSVSFWMKLILCKVIICYVYCRSDALN